MSSREANTANMPSATAMALLEAHVNNNATETSSIPTASAKMYPLKPHEIPELTGVITSRDPPCTIYLTRSQSFHRLSSHIDVVKKSGVDPEEECLELPVVDPPSAMKRLRRKTTTTEAIKGRSKSRLRKDKDHTAATTTVVEPSKSSSKSIHTSSIICSPHSRDPLALELEDPIRKRPHSQPVDNAPVLGVKPRATELPSAAFVAANEVMAQHECEKIELFTIFAGKGMPTDKTNSQNSHSNGIIYCFECSAIVGGKRVVVGVVPWPLMKSRASESLANTTAGKWRRAPQP
jgi:hypothetical protein